MSLYVMSEISHDNLKAIESKLNNLVKVIMNKAESDPEFASKLEEVLLSDSLRKSISNKKTKAKKENFNAVAYLHEHGEPKLQEELSTKTDDELRQIMRSEGIKIQKVKGVKSIDRQEIIEEIVLKTQRRLNQGSVFLSTKKTQETEKNDGVSGTDQKALDVTP